MFSKPHIHLEKQTYSDDPHQTLTKKNIARVYIRNNKPRSSANRYNVIFMILTYFMPIGAMTFTYARIGVELWGSQSIGEATQRQLDNIRNKRRVMNR